MIYLLSAKQKRLYAIALAIFIAGVLFIADSRSELWGFLLLAVSLAVAFITLRTGSEHESKDIQELLKYKGYHPLSVKIERYASLFHSNNVYIVSYKDPAERIFTIRCTYDVRDRTIYWSESPKDLNKSDEQITLNTEASAKPPKS